jgi:IS6 family transposase
MAVAVRWYLRCGPSYRDVEELLAERGIGIDHVKVVGRWQYLYRAVDQHGQVIDVMVSPRPNGGAARAFFTTALRLGPTPCEVTTDKAPVYPRVVDEAVPADAWTHTRPVTSDRRGRARIRTKPMPQPQRVRE